MALTLASFPVEVLAHITGYLTDVEVLIALPLCGNRNLTAKMKTGGVTHLESKLSSLSQGNIDFAYSLRLRSLTISDFSRVEQLRNFVHGAPATITYLKVCMDDVGALFDGDELDLDSAFNRLRHTAKQPWIVSSTFPQLKTFIIEHEGSLQAFYDDIFTVKFLRGLPPSLTHFAPPRNFGNGIDLWKFLPSDLVELGPVRMHPSFTVPDLPSLRKLDFKLLYSKKDHDDKFGHAIGGWAKRTEAGKEDLKPWPISDEIQLVLPAQLTHLKAEIPSLYSIESYPSTLTSFTVHFTSHVPFYATLSDIASLSNSSPLLAHLNVKIGFLFGEWKELTSIKPFTYLKSFAIKAIRGKPMTSKAMAELLLLLPNVEALTLRLGLVPLQVSHLALLNGALLHTLKAPIDPSCLAETINTSIKTSSGKPSAASCTTPIALALPKLRTLKLYPIDLKEEDNDDEYNDGIQSGDEDDEDDEAPIDHGAFSDDDDEDYEPRRNTRPKKSDEGPEVQKETILSFASVPPTVTCLQSKIPSFSTKTLHLLPPSVTSYRTRSLVVHDDDNWNTLFNDPRVPKPPANKGKLHTLVVSDHYRMERLNSKLNGDRKSNVLLVPCDEKAATLKLEWKNVEKFPSSLTSLIIKDGISFSDRVLLSAISPRSLPHLRTLQLGKNDLPSGMELGGFSMLLSLRLASIDDKITSFCPPNLTELISDGATLLPPNFLPLPRSITLLQCNGNFQPPTAIGSLFKLKSLKGNKTVGFNLDTLKHLPATLTDLDVLAESLQKDENVTLLRSLCPSLEKISLEGAMTATALATLQGQFPKVAISAHKVDVSDCAVIASLAGSSPKSISIPVGLPLSEWGIARLASAFPKRERWIKMFRNSMTAAQVISFCEFLTPTTPYLNFYCTEVCPTHVLPRFLTELAVAGKVSLSHEAASSLPPTLKSLDLAFLDLDFISLLPRGLTQLSIGTLEFDSEKTLPSIEWPPTVTDICLGQVSTTMRTHVFKSFPESLRFLNINHMLELKATEVTLLPTSLRYIKIPYANDNSFATIRPTELTFLRNKSAWED